MAARVQRRGRLVRGEERLHCSRVSLGRVDAGAVAVARQHLHEGEAHVGSVGRRGAGEETAPPPIEVEVDRASVPAGDPNAIADARDACGARRARRTIAPPRACLLVSTLSRTSRRTPVPPRVVRTATRRVAGRHFIRKKALAKTWRSAVTPTMNRLHTRVSFVSSIVRVCDGPTTEDLA